VNLDGYSDGAWVLGSYRVSGRGVCGEQRDLRRVSARKQLANDCSAQVAGSSGDENHRKGQLDELSSSNVRRPSSEGTLRVDAAG